MDKDLSAKIAASSAEYERLMAPVNVEIRDRLAGNVALNGRMLEDMQTAEAHRTANEALLSGFFALLPHAAVGKDQILVPDAYMARQFYANAIDITDKRPRDSFSTRAQIRGFYYTFGSKKGDNLDREERLLYSASGGHRQPIARVEVLDSEANIASEEARRALFTAQDFAQEELSHMFDSTNGKLNVSYAWGMAGVTRGVVNEGLYPYRFKRDAKLRDKGMHMQEVKTNGYTSISDQLTWSDATFGTYDIPNHLIKLATAFNVSDELATLLEKHTLSISGDASARLVNE
jgi:hypothetical protein